MKGPFFKFLSFEGNANKHYLVHIACLLKILFMELNLAARLLYDRQRVEYIVGIKYQLKIGPITSLLLGLITSKIPSHLVMGFNSHPATNFFPQPCSRGILSFPLFSFSFSSFFHFMSIFTIYGNLFLINNV